MASNTTDGSETGGKQASEEYSAQVASAYVNGEARLSLVEDGLRIVTALDALELGFVEMLGLSIADYVVTIVTAYGDFRLSRMGTWCEPFYEAIYEAYQKKTLKALFENGPAILSTIGDYRYYEKEILHQGRAAIQVHKDCLCILPPNIDARRVPFCFVQSIEKKDFDFTLSLDEIDSYSCLKLGYDTDPFVEAIEAQLRALRERTLETIKDLDPGLSSIQSLAIAKLMPEGAAASISQLERIAPSFVAAIEARIAASRASESYGVFKELSGREHIYVGLKRGETFRAMGSSAGGRGIGALGGIAEAAFDGLVSDSSAEVEESTSDPYLIWLIAPSTSGRACAVEFAGGAEDSAATFVYRIEGRFDYFVAQLNRALEAIDFRREVIRLKDEELSSPSNLNYLMAIQRNTALQFIRRQFTERLIHRSLEGWKESLCKAFS